MSDNGRYRIPRDNPFVAVAGARKEIWAYGFRNPHRLELARRAAERAHLIASMIGWRTWETVLFIHKGANYGYPLREGSEVVDGDSTSPALPQPDALPVHVTDTDHGRHRSRHSIQCCSTDMGRTAATRSPAASSTAASGFRSLPASSSSATSRPAALWYADYKEMRAADDGVRERWRRSHELQIWWDDPADSPDRGRQLYPTLAPIVSAAYHSRGGKDPDLPGSGAVSGAGRVDLRLADRSSGRALSAQQERRGGREL